MNVIVDRLTSARMTPIVVPKTTSELRRAGLVGVCCIVPELQPLTLHPCTQYRGHPRLYDLPRKLGHEALPEQQINADPVPFA
jgi:ribosomal protein S12 methylthiotransferase accessory factor